MAGWPFSDLFRCALEDPMSADMQALQAAGLPFFNLFRCALENSTSVTGL